MVTTICDLAWWSSTRPVAYAARSSDAHSAFASGLAKPSFSFDTPMSRWDAPVPPPRVAGTSTATGSKSRSRRSGTAAMSANVSYMLNDFTRSQMGSPAPRSSTPPSPPQNVALNHAASQRAGSPARASPSDAARRQSCSIDVRCAFRRRQPMGLPVWARPS